MRVEGLPTRKRLLMRKATIPFTLGAAVGAFISAHVMARVMIRMHEQWRDDVGIGRDTPGQDITLAMDFYRQRI
jgi:hypothetical protein